MVPIWIMFTKHIHTNKHTRTHVISQHTHAHTLIHPSHDTYTHGTHHTVYTHTQIDPSITQCTHTHTHTHTLPITHTQTHIDPPITRHIHTRYPSHNAHTHTHRSTHHTTHTHTLPITHTHRHPPPSKLSNVIKVPLFPDKDIPVDLNVKAFVGHPTSSQFHVFEASRPLPRFSLYIPCSVAIEPRPSGRVVFHLSERLDRVRRTMRRHGNTCLRHMA